MGCYYVTDKMLCLRANGWVLQDVFFTFNYNYLILCNLNDFNFKLVLSHCFRNAKINISSVANSSNQHNLAVLINSHLYVRIKHIVFALGWNWKLYNPLSFMIPIFGFWIATYNLRIVTLTLSFMCCTVISYAVYSSISLTDCLQ